MKIKFCVFKLRETSIQKYLRLFGFCFFDFFCAKKSQHDRVMAQLKREHDAKVSEMERDHADRRQQVQQLHKQIEDSDKNSAQILEVSQ